MLACMMASSLPGEPSCFRASTFCSFFAPLLRVLSLGRDHGGRYAAKTGSFDTLQVGMVTA